MVLRSAADALHRLTRRFWWAFVFFLLQAAQSLGDDTVDEGGAGQPEDRNLRGDPVRDVLSTVVGVLRHVSQEHHEKPPQRDVGIACMLLGSVGFVMLLFYIVNWKDDDIRLYAWTIISTTTCLFTAVLSFSGIKVVSDLLIHIPEEMNGVECVRAYLLFILAFSTLQLAAKLISGAYCDCCCPVDMSEEAWVVADSLRADHGDEVDEKQVRTKTGQRSVAWIEGVEVFVERRKLNLERSTINVRAWAQLLAHLSGFAALEAGGALQHMEWFRETPLRAFLAVVINQVSIGILFRGMDVFRLYTIYDNEDERVVMLGEAIEEAENDIISLSSSFLTVQVLRFSLSGQLPDLAGRISPYQPSGMFTIAMLLLFGTVALAMSLALTFVPCENRLLLWLTEKFQNILGMIFAWCSLWGVHMFVRETGFFHETLGTTLYPNERHLIAALFLSMCALAAIRVLDIIQDMGASFPRLLQNMINVFSVLIGLSWEMCFEHSLEELSEETVHPEAMKLIFTVCAVAIVLPAWRMFIVRRVMHLERKHQERQEAKVKIANGEDPAYTALLKQSPSPPPEELAMKQDLAPKSHRSSGCW